MLLPPRGARSMSLLGWGLEKGQPRGQCAGGELSSSPHSSSALPARPAHCPSFLPRESHRVTPRGCRSPARSAAGPATAPCPLNKAARTPGLQHRCHLSLAFPPRPGAASGTMRPRAPQRRPAPPTSWGGCGDGIEPPDPTTDQGWRCCAATGAAVQAGELLGCGAPATEWQWESRASLTDTRGWCQMGGRCPGLGTGNASGRCFRERRGWACAVCQTCSTQTPLCLCPPHAMPALTTGKLCTQRW